MKRTPYALMQSVHGPLLVNPNDIWVGRALLATGCYAPAQADLLLDWLPAGGTVIEVGAHCGAHTVALAGKAGHVLAFEPQRVLFQQLCANLALGGHWNVDARCNAATAAYATLRVPQLAPDAPQNFGGLSLAGSNDGEDVTGIPLDEFELKACDLIKIDVEGMELDVLQGGAELVDRFRPVIYAEADRPDKAPALIAWLQARAYRTFWHFSELVPGAAGQQLFGRQVLSFDLLAIPEEHGFAIQRGDLCPAEPGDTHVIALGRLNQ